MMTSAKELLKRVVTSLISIFVFIVDTLIILLKNPSRFTNQISKVTNQISEVKIPKMFRKPIFLLYSKRYNVLLDEIIQPLDSF